MPNKSNLLFAKSLNFAILFTIFTFGILSNCQENYIILAFDKLDILVRNGILILVLYCILTKPFFPRNFISIYFDLSITRLLLQHVMPNNNINIHSCINTYAHSCLKPLSNQTKAMFKSWNLRAV